ncbi:uncharacterized protein EI90DRAFT_3021563 [Cantharellus anzutake]|uniref:uncharacterized protein n=1 Tax=Cantharellus anzutake TaxID=1750568 RepID=UPI00190579F7|nr:uncharacterized protein EI90DRAFT_3021563 [Cantharellus anzutake]KAF8316479.1 hypothetical protein EI90DRAFT_3021563 [Cantharellus anzutake]
MPLRMLAQSTHNHDALASSTQDTLSYQVPDSAATSPPWGDVRTLPKAVRRRRDLTLIIEAIREFVGGVFNDPDTPMTKICNWQRIMPAWLERELVPDDSAKPTLQYQLMPLQEFDELRLGGFRPASVPHTTFTDRESVERAWSAEIRPTCKSTHEMLGWELNSQCEPAVDEVTFIHQCQQLPIELPAPRPSINVAAAML